MNSLQHRISFSCGRTQVNGCYVLTIIKIYLLLLGRQIYREKQTQRHLTCAGLFPKWPEWWPELSQFKTRHFLQVFHLNAGCHGQEPSSKDFPGHKLGSRWKRSRPEMIKDFMRCQHCSILPCYATMPAPSLLIYISQAIWHQNTIIKFEWKM